MTVNGDRNFTVKVRYNRKGWGKGGEGGREDKNAANKMKEKTTKSRLINLMIVLVTPHHFFPLYLQNIL